MYDQDMKLTSLSRRLHYHSSFLSGFSDTPPEAVGASVSRAARESLTAELFKFNTRAT